MVDAPVLRRAERIIQLSALTGGLCSENDSRVVRRKLERRLGQVIKVVLDSLRSSVHTVRRFRW